MPVYVDALFDCPGPHGFNKWCHMTADTLAELHEMANAIGMKLAWFQDKPGFPHYDLVPTRRKRAVRLGAIELSRKEMVKLTRRKLLGPAEFAFATGTMNAIEYLAAIEAEPTDLTVPPPGRIDTRRTIEGRRPSRRVDEVTPMDAVAVHAFSEFLKRAGAPPHHFSEGTIDADTEAFYKKAESLYRRGPE